MNDDNLLFNYINTGYNTVLWENEKTRIIERQGYINEATLTADVSDDTYHLIRTNIFVQTSSVFIRTYLQKCSYKKKFLYTKQKTARSPITF